MTGLASRRRSASGRTRRHRHGSRAYPSDAVARRPRTLRVSRTILLAPVVAVLVALPAPVTAAPASGSWAPAGELSTARPETTVTALADGRVLVAGGGIPPVASADLFDPRATAWAPTAAMEAARGAHAAVTLADGRVLVSGGRSGGEALNSAEIFDPSTGAWTPSGAMALARQAHTATLLPDGRVLVTGGLGGSHGPHRAEAELFDPATGAWALTGAMPQPRAHHTASRLVDGRVLVVGGEGAPHDASLRDAAVFDPATAAWTPVAQLLATGRSDHTATVLADGTVLVAGGTKLHIGGRPENFVFSTEILDRQASAILPAPAMVHRRSYHAATVLPGGGVLVTGGISERAAQPVATAEVYDPAARAWASVAPMPAPAADHAAVVLAGDACATACGKVLVVGERAAYLFSPSAGSGRNRVAGALAGALGAGVVMLGVATVIRRRRGTARRGLDQTLERR